MDKSAARAHLQSILAKVCANLEKKSMDAYSAALQVAVRALYNHAVSINRFIDHVTMLITDELTEAWNKGADESQVLPEDMTAEDTQALQDIINAEAGYIGGFADDIQQAAKDKTSVDQFDGRIGTWVNRINETENKAKIYFGGKTKYVWHYGETEHCKTCEALNNIVMWASEWEDVGVTPGEADSPYLDCGGWNCKCSLDSTTERRTRGGKDKVLGIIS